MEEERNELLNRLRYYEKEYDSNYCEQQQEQQILVLKPKPVLNNLNELNIFDKTSFFQNDSFQNSFESNVSIHSKLFIQQENQQITESFCHNNNIESNQGNYAQ